MYKISERKKLVDVALGETSPDVVIKNGKLVNVHTREIYEADVIISGERLAAVGEGEYMIDDECKVIDAEGQFVAPGFIDPHVHLESTAVTISEFAKQIVPRGVTSFVEDPHEIVNVLGKKAIDLFYDEVQNLPINMFLRVPGRVPAMVDELETSGARITIDETKKLLERPEAVCLAGDINPGLILSKNDEQFEKISYAVELGKTVSGQSPGLKGNELNAFISAGPEDSHVSEDTEEVIDIIRHGMRALVTHRPSLFGVDDYPEFVEAIKEKKIDTRLISFCTDDIEPHILLNEGHLELRLKNAIKNGLNPVVAIQMATINTANFLRITRDYGSVSPGKFADILVLDSLDDVKVDKVLYHGKLVAEKGELIIDLPDFEYPEWAKDTINVQKKVSAEDFQVRVPKSERAKVQVMIPGEPKHAVIKEIDVHEGVAEPDQDNDILSISVIDRHKASGNIGKGFISGIGLRGGAIASTVSHDAHNIFVIGSNHEDMAIAANKVIDLKGGHVLVKDGKVIATVPLPIAGLMSEKPIEIAAEEFEIFENLATEKLGVEVDYLLYLLNFLCLPNIPFVGLTDKGLIDSKSLEVMEVVVK